MKREKNIIGLFGNLVIRLFGGKPIIRFFLLPNQQINRINQCMGILLIGILIVGFQSSLFAYGTTANTIISSPSNNYEVGYQDGNNVFVATVNPTVDVDSDPVTAVYGIRSLVSSDQTTRSIKAGQPITTLIEHVILSLSNLGVTVNYSNSVFEEITPDVGNPANWEISSDTNTFTGVLFDQTITFNLNVTADAAAVYASQAGVTVNYVLSEHIESQVVSYNGLNDQTYGGAATQSVLLTFTVEGPNLVVVSSTLNIEAPSGYSGTGTDLVPGSKITYEYVIQNLGNAVANNMDIVQAIPTDTTFFEIPNSSDITENSTTVGVDVDYFEGSWLGILTASSNVTQIRFNQSSLSAGNYVTVNYTVTVD